MKESMEETLGQIEVELDGTFASLRTKETNLGKYSALIYHMYEYVSLVQLKNGDTVS